MRRTDTTLAGAAAACLLAIVMSSTPMASAEATATLNVPPVCLVDATGETTTVTKEMCGIQDVAGLTLRSTLPRDYEIGTHWITWEGLSAGLRMSETQMIVVMDLTPPDITPPPAVLGYEATGPESSPPLGDADVSDVNKQYTPGKDHNPKPPFPVGTHRVTWEAKDNSDLKATATQVVEIVDTTKPTITCDDVRVKSKTPVPTTFKPLADKLQATLADTVDGTKDLLPPAGTPNPLPHGKMTPVTYEYTDASGNVADPCKQNVYVLDPSTIATLPSTGGVEGHTFGRALAFGKDTLFVGDPGYTDTAMVSGTATTMANSGIVKAYRLMPGEGQPTEYTIKPETPAENLGFGSALAVVSSGTTEVLAVGAPGKSIVEEVLRPDEKSPEKSIMVEVLRPNVGEVYLHSAATGASAGTISNPASPSADRFGAALAPMGDRLVVGAHNYDQGAVTNAGRVYVYDSAGSEQYRIASPAPAKNGKFGQQVEATVEGETRRIYVGSRTDGATGAVYVYDVTGATATSVPAPELTAKRPSGFASTEFGTKQIRPAGGGVYVGEPGAGKIHEYPAGGGERGEFAPHMDRRNMFGAAFDADERLLYAGIHTPGAASPLQAFRLGDRAYAEGFLSTANTPTGYYHARFGYMVEASGNWVAATDVLERFGEDDSLQQKTRVRVLDLRTLDPDIVYPAAASATVPIPGSQEQSSAQQGAPRPAQPQMTQVLEAPSLLSTESLGPDKIRLTYNVSIDPFEVDIDDYALSDASLEVVAVDVSGSTVTLTYVGGAPGAAAAKPPGVELVGGIGYY